MFGTTGHSNNHDGNNHGYAMMVFKVEIDTSDEVLLSTLTMRDLT